jgi:hypothetical protein
MGYRSTSADSGSVRGGKVFLIANKNDLKNIINKEIFLYMEDIFASIYDGDILFEVEIQSGSEIQIGDNPKKIKAKIKNIKFVDKIEQSTIYMLIAHGANIRAAHDILLVWAAENGYNNLIKYLLKKGCDVATQNDLPIRKAVLWGRLETVKLLIENGANPYRGNLADVAATWGNLEVLKFLKEIGVTTFNISDYALERAAKMGNLAMVKYLVEECQIPININALEAAARYERFEIAKYLRIKGNFPKKVLFDNFEITF